MGRVKTNRDVTDKELSVYFRTDRFQTLTVEEIKDAKLIRPENSGPMLCTDDGGDFVRGVGAKQSTDDA